ncbi:hypothetical protein NC653_022941 [Populus alba x Populus x berolinensis]|uniref:NAD-dependent epimerase/dehydratase domain-containing protein n=1 Tax=Populus alba x Populus x berolinensis TaxID=444605 RepID=A0AAD6QC82_9ROSI|nr:hypothetical protein NC653_022941 [Populus alba x Populus x berolinensis]
MLFLNAQTLTNEWRRKSRGSGYIATWLVKLLLLRGYTVKATVRDPRGSGYIASWLVKLLLHRGYTVKATVRDPNDPKRTEHLLNLDGAKERLHLFKANLVEEGSFDPVVDGCESVFHVASPVFLGTNDPQADLIEPAVKGTLNVLKSCAKFPSVKRVILTSSMASVAFNGKPLTPDVVVDETWFSDSAFCVSNKLWYMASKTLAEEAAWKFAKETGIDMVTINPGFVIGPLLQPTLNSSAELFLDHISGGAQGAPRLPSEIYRFVDVRDVAYAHIQALEIPSASGGSGYIASWLVKLLLHRGYTVKATVRDPNDPKRTEHLLNLDGAKERLHLFKANLVEEGSFDPVVDGCESVFHVASPVLLGTNIDPQADLIEPAVKGTLNVLKSCAKFPSVKRVILTSSMASVAFSGKPLTPDVVVDETWFSDSAFCVSNKLWYMASKTLAEEAAWKFAKEKGIDMVTINPGFVIGPLLQPTLKSTAELFLDHINGGAPGLPSEIYRFVDVRDVAYAHIQALEIPSASGRYCVVGRVTHFSDAVKIAHELYPTLPLPENGEGKVVSVTGASGYIASWLVKLLLERGYTVKASVRDPNDAKKTEHLLALDGAKERLQLFKADLLDEGSFDPVVEGCECVFHTASPFYFTVNDPQAELVDPALKGTVNVLRSCTKIPSIKRVVITSSMAAVVFNGKSLAPDVVVDETWFSDSDFCEKSKLWYHLSKTLAEEAAWKFTKENGIDMVTLNPGLVIGPLLQPTLNQSAESVLDLINGAKSYPNTTYRWVDVRDVANAHIYALENPSANGRYCLVGTVIHSSEAVKILSKLYPDLTIPKQCADDKPPMPKYQVSKERAASLGVKYTPLEERISSLVSYRAVATATERMSRGGDGKVVCVTGGSGYIASWLVKLLLQRGYTVKTTVRDPNDPKKTEHLLALDGAKERLHLFKANLLEEGAFDPVVDGCEGVFHTASPVSFSPNDDPQVDLIDPALKGTLNVLRSCAKVHSIRRVVLTSSSAACIYSGKPLNHDVVIDETWHSDPAICKELKAWYALSKTLAEEAAWNFAKENATDLVTLHPSFVIGPLLQPTLNLSVEMILNLVNGAETYPNEYYRCIDVRDVANAHIQAFEIPSASGRYGLTAYATTFSEVLKIIRENYPTLRLPEKSTESKFKPYQVSKEKAKTLDRAESVTLCFYLVFGPPALQEYLVRVCSKVLLHLLTFYEGISSLVSYRAVATGTERMNRGGDGKVVCVTGGSGYIASWLVKLLLQRGYTVKTTVRDPSQ